MARDETRGAPCPQATPEQLDAMVVVTETENYKLVVLSPEMRDIYDTNYGIVNKDLYTIEAMYGVLFAAYQLIRELQAKLTEEMPASAPTLNIVH